MINTQNIAHFKSCKGFSLVDVMVGMVVGLITMLIIMQSYAAFEGQKRTSTSGMEALENGLIALHALETDIRQAGFGLTTNGFLACTSVNTYNSASTPTTASGVSLVPIQIKDGGAGSDSIIITYSTSSTGGIPAHIVVAMPDSSAVLTVDLGNVFTPGDILYVATPGSALPCTRLVATSSNTTANGVNIVHNSGLSNYNPPGGSNIFPSGGYGTNAVVLNLGTMVQNRYDVFSPCYSLTATDLTTSTAARGCTNTSTFTGGAVPISSNIVSIQAQYGIASPPALNQSVYCWVNATNGGNSNCSAADNADNWLAPVAANVARIKAVRVAVVARSSLKERPSTPGGVCDATPSASAPNYPQWAGGAIDVTKNPDGTANADWMCYRYKVYQTTIPLRNIMWANI